ncbi:MAG: hypothetical protein JNM84_13415 [Planctomycetes bacterium]|nr:hypothetical protein [Planctomycetota bacterium]
MDRNTAEQLERAPKLRIWVFATGAIEVDGKPVELDDVRKALEELAVQSGAVLYGRESPSAEPHPNAMQIIKWVVENQLPIRLCKERDFSDA